MSARLIRRNKQTYSTKPTNLKARNSFQRADAPQDGGHGAGARWQRRGSHHAAKMGQRKPAASSVRSGFPHLIRKNKHRRDPRMDAIGRASSILRSQKQVKVKSKGPPHQELQRAPPSKLKAIKLPSACGCSKEGRTGDSVPFASYVSHLNENVATLFNTALSCQFT
ncbi:PREDICTED: 60S ribosomal protein L28-like [Myotis brandtii]|uniref:60S ribosomal protein L28-like n=1 Tax=Myotis brandtii TaxID=109478 RepID=UPI0007045C05|nr:PREDICTED: 60S ribosomal protein L28-like [Myotis brandtii]